MPYCHVKQILICDGIEYFKSIALIMVILSQAFEIAFTAFRQTCIYFKFRFYVHCLP